MFGFQETGNKIKNEGQCFLCKNKYSNRTILKHIKECTAEYYAYDRNGKKAEDILLIRITSEDKLFWLYLEVRSSAQLADLDYFLKDKWLECCGHLSLFMVNGKRYSEDLDFDDGFDFGDIDTNISCKSVFNIGDTFTHEYDFGSTTILHGEVLEKRIGLLERKVKLIARNMMPDFVCLPCKSPATYVCPFCVEFSCSKCSKKHNCKQGGNFEMFLPVVNSPRMGTCGYMGAKL